MKRQSPPVQRKKPITVYVAAMASLLTAVAIVMEPEVAFAASRAGLTLWFDVVLPALFPFFVMAEIMMGLGVIHGIGVLLEPIMRPVFRIPGVGGFAVAMGLASGYPLGAKISGRLRRAQLCSQVEGERLVAFANTADPLFMMGAVAIGMFGMPEVGLPIAISHYVAAVTVGFLMRFHGGKSTRVDARPSPSSASRSPALVVRAARAIVQARHRDGRPFGELFGDAVKETMQSMLFIGGCIMMFSVLMQVASALGIMAYVVKPVAGVLTALGLSEQLAPAIWQGLMEITIGTEATALASAPLRDAIIVAGGVIGWSGFSVHSQVAAMLHGTDLRMTPYLTARFAHGLFAALLTALLFKPLVKAAPVAHWLGVPAFSPGWGPSLWVLWSATATRFAIILTAFVALGLVAHFLRRLRVIAFIHRG